MPDMNQLGLFLTAALVLALLPGPALIYVATRTLAGGRAEGVSTSLGTALGGMVHVIGGAVGVSALLLASAGLFAAVKLAGAAYLVWLGVRTIRGARADAAAIAAGLDGATPLGARRAFREGVMVEALNPKTAAFFLALLPQFVDLAHGHVAAQFVVLGLISVGLNTTADLVMAVAAGALRSRIVRRPSLVRRLREAAGTGMIALGAGLLLSRRPA